MDPERKALIANFIQFIQRTLFPIDAPEKYRELIEKGNDYWVRDWTEIEVLKVLLIGEEAYLSDPLSHRCRMSSSYKPDEIIKVAQEKLKIEEEFKLKASSLPGIIIFEKVGRGIDLLLAKTVKVWKKAYCFDDDSRYEELLRRYFSLNYEIEFITSKDGLMIESEIKEPGCVVWALKEGI